MQYLLQDVHWTDLVNCGKDTDSETLENLPEIERKRREAVWELFRSETVFLVDYLMVLKHVSILILSLNRALLSPIEKSF